MMINPIVVAAGSSHILFEETYPNQDAFLIIKDRSFVAFCNTRHDKNSTLFYWDVNKPNKTYRIASRDVTKNVFIDFLAKTYPEHYEWFLWNPDFL